MTPSRASAPARLAACACPRVRRISTARSKSPSASISAFRQSLIPPPVRSRSVFTSFALGPSALTAALPAPAPAPALPPAEQVALRAPRLPGALQAPKAQQALRPPPSPEARRRPAAREQAEPLRGRVPPA